MIAVMARYNPFAEHAGMNRVCESKPDKSILEPVNKIEKLGFTSYLLSVPEDNKQKLKGQNSAKPTKDLFFGKKRISNSNYLC